jgi:glycosyltransferase involved in cell wall biosynthesis
MRICLIYDCLYPHTVGGAERWYRDLAERLADAGHEVTYLTLRQWERGERPQLDARVRVVSAGPRMGLYTASGRRRILPPLVFGAGVLWHLLRHGGRYEVVHTCSFPYFPLLAAAAVRRLRGYGLVVDWFEVWSREYWREYLGGVAGLIGLTVQRLCARVPQRAFCFSELHARRLEGEGMGAGSRTLLRGLYAGASAPAEPREPARLVLFAGRLIPEKRAPLGVEAVALAAQRIEGLRGVFYGEGPERAALDAAIARVGAGPPGVGTADADAADADAADADAADADAANADAANADAADAPGAGAAGTEGLEAIVSAPGFASSEELERDMRRALCLLLPSQREGYGLVVVEAAAHSTPSVVVAAPDNAAVELVEQGLNGIVVARDTPQAVADAIVDVWQRGLALRESTARWFAQNAQQLSLESSLQAVLRSYAGGAGEEAGGTVEAGGEVEGKVEGAVQADGTAAKPSARA